MKGPLLVSVIVPTFNRRAMLREAMDSVRAQTHRPIELVVVDDGSIDDTPEMVSAWRTEHARDDGLHVLYLRKANGGAPSARNMGFAASTGAYVQFLDSDDLLHPEKLASAVAVMENDAAVQMVCSRMERKDVLTGETTPFVGADLQSRPTPAEVALRFSQTMIPVFRRTVVALAGPWDETLLALQDWEFFGRLLLHVERAVQIPQVQCTVREHGINRISRQTERRAVLEASRLEAIRSVMDSVRASGGDRAAERRLMHLYAAAVLAVLRLDSRDLAIAELMKDCSRWQDVRGFSTLRLILRILLGLPEGAGRTVSSWLSQIRSGIR